MKILLVVVVLWTLVELPVLTRSFSLPYDIYQTVAGSSPLVIHYNRSTDIEKHCSSFLTSASELKPDHNRGDRLKTELSFYVGDWKQEKEGPPLMKHDDEYPIKLVTMMQRGDDIIPDDNIPGSTQSLLKLVSFEVKDVSSVQQLANTVSVGAVLTLGISMDTPSFYSLRSNPHLNHRGSSVMAIVFEGVYVENGEERLMCLLGSLTSNSPSTDADSDCDHDQLSKFAGTNHVHGSTVDKLRFLTDDQILLVLRYPTTFSLIKREIKGEITSLHNQNDSSYFSKVYISSQLTDLSKYQFSSDLFLQSTTFHPSPYQDELMEDGVSMFSAREFCRVLGHISGEVLNVVPNYRFSGSYLHQIHGKLGPFSFNNETDATGGLIYEDIKLAFQNVKCERDTNSGSTDSAKVSAVMRAVQAGNAQYSAGLRTGVSGMTLAAEGIWNSSSGQLFMVGCQRKDDLGLEECDYEIAMYFPHSFSIRQRSALFGSIFSRKKDRTLDNPLFFNAKSDIYSECSSYNYSEIKLVNMFEMRTLPDQISTIIKRWLFQYPALKEAGEPLAKLSQLSIDLSFNGYVVPDYHPTDGQKSRILIEIGVLCLGQLCGSYDTYMYNRNPRKKPVITTDDLTSNRFLNVSLHLKFRSQKEGPTTYKDISELSLEGLYDPILGEMHLIGCRKAMAESINVERGQDCLIEVKIQYPPKNFLWWKNPTATISISSQRKEDDPLYFSMIKLDSVLMHHREYFETVANRKLFKGILCILMLAGSIAMIWSQLLYMKVNADIVPYISTFTLVSQILGYSLPLICDAKLLLKSDRSEAYGMLKVLKSLENVLLLVALLLTARLFQMVTESRSKLHSKGSITTLTRASRLKRVLLCAMAIYSIEFLTWIVARDDSDVHNHLQPENAKYIPKNAYIQQTWMIIIEDFVIWCQELFLLPQILSNIVIPTPAKLKPLRKAYYLGFTSIRLLVHFFDHIMDPANLEVFEFMSLNSTSPLFTKLVGPMRVIMTAVVVYIQQK